MAEKKNQFGGPAFPSPAFVDPETLATVRQPVEGMSLQTYAAIHLCVPMSEHPIVNEMINKARLDKFAAAALSGLLSDFDGAGRWTIDDIASAASDGADAMLRAREAANE